MMKTIGKRVFAAIALASVVCICNAQRFEWVKQLGGPSFDEGLGIAVDSLGNSYTCGVFDSIADFDPDPVGTHWLESAGYHDIFVSKLDANGNFVWAIRIGGLSSDRVNGIASDANGNTYFTGTFMETVDFDPDSVGIFNLSPIGNQDIFILKLNPDGAMVWAKQIGGTSFNLGNSIAMDALGHIYIAGEFRQVVDFDPGAGTFDLNSFGYTDIFVWKLDTAGNFL